MTGGRKQRAVVHPNAAPTGRREGVAQVHAPPALVVVGDVSRPHVLSAKDQQGLDEGPLGLRTQGDLHEVFPYERRRSCSVGRGHGGPGVLEVVLVRPRGAAGVSSLLSTAGADVTSGSHDVRFDSPVVGWATGRARHHRVRRTAVAVLMVADRERVFGGRGRPHRTGSGSIVACGKEHEETLLIRMRAVVCCRAVVDVLRRGRVLALVAGLGGAPRIGVNAGPLGIGLIQNVVQTGREELPVVVVFHRLEDQFSLRGDPGVTATAAVAEHGARHVCAVSRVLVRGGAVTDHIGVGQHACTEIAVVRVQS